MSFPEALKILYITPFVPYLPLRGTHERVFQLLKALADHHQATAFCLTHEAEEKQHQPVLAAFCEKVIFQPVQLNPWRSLPTLLLAPHHPALLSA